MARHRPVARPLPPEEYDRDAATRRITELVSRRDGPRRRLRRACRCRSSIRPRPRPGRANGRPRRSDRPKDRIRITRLETFLVKPRWLFLKVHTNAGIVGLGEPIVEGRALDGRGGGQGDRALPGRQGPAAGRPSLAGDLPPRLLSRRPDPDQRPERHRHGPLGHQGQGARRAGVRAAGRPDATAGPRLRPRRHARTDQGPARTGLHRVQDPARDHAGPRGTSRRLAQVHYAAESSPSCARPPATTSTSPSTSTARSARRPPSC